ncbi:MAG: isoprenyl transferase [Clostridia bacterium]|nr:isoprenyl transferase [Clostridia bacterium]
MSWFKKKKVTLEKVDMSNLPSHIAIIMDGNGRWAKKRGLPRTAGHKVGSETFRTIATYCNDIGIKYLTVYAFSTENWKRPQDEVDAIMNLLEEYILEAFEKVRKDNIKLTFWGDRTRLSPKLQQMMNEVEEKSRDMTGIHVNVCLNYGGRDEIARATKEIATAVKNGEISVDEITEQMISDSIYSKDVPDPELIIRPSGEIRTSNFLLWQSAYSEYYFTDVLWPDFKPIELDRAILAYQNRSRRFGGV